MNRIRIAHLMIIGLLMSSMVIPTIASAQQMLPVYFFWGEGCPHCEEEKIALEELEKQYAIRVHSLEVWNNRDNASLLQQAANALQTNVGGVPFTVIGDQPFTGFSRSAMMPAMTARIEECLKSGCPDSLAPLFAGNAVSVRDATEPIPSTVPADNTTDALLIDLPFFGTIDVMQYSLPAITIIIAGLDGFNPCAMWTLIFLLGLLVGMKSRWRRWTLGSAFIVTSAAVYFLFLAAWLNLILFLGFLWWIRASIGLVALGGGAYYLKEYVTNKEGTCKVTGGERRQRIFQRIRDITHEHSFLPALIGIMLLAIAVNLVEVLCSAGLPAVYAQVLALNALTTVQYYGYLLLYVFIFLLDDLFIFFAGMLTLEVTGMTSKYARASHLIGGILMIILGLLLLYKPEWLMFG